MRIRLMLKVTHQGAALVAKSDVRACTNCPAVFSKVILGTVKENTFVLVTCFMTFLSFSQH